MNCYLNHPLSNKNDIKVINTLIGANVTPIIRLLFLLLSYYYNHY